MLSPTHGELLAPIRFGNPAEQSVIVVQSKTMQAAMTRRYKGAVLVTLVLVLVSLVLMGVRRSAVSMQARAEITRLYEMIALGAQKEDVYRVFSTNRFRTCGLSRHPTSWFWSKHRWNGVLLIGCSGSIWMMQPW